MSAVAAARHEDSTFTAFMRSRLPQTVELPLILAELFDWIDENNWIVTGRVDGDPYGCIAPDERWMHDGTAVSFHIDPPEVRARSSALWIGIEGLHDVLVPFAKTGADGSQAAFWVGPDGVQRIVHMGSGSGSVVVCVLATEPIDFLRLLAIGYPEICWLADPAFALPPARDDGWSITNVAFRDWISAHGVAIPETARELVPAPAQMGELDSGDLFCDWLNELGN
jgi:hypothetical protein